MHGMRAGRRHGAQPPALRLRRLRDHVATRRAHGTGVGAAGSEAGDGRVYFLRHGQSVYNNAVASPPEGWGMRDPVLWDGPLTTLGQAQARAARDVVDAIPNLGLIVVSPLTRALQTCELACERAIARGVRALVQPLVRERVSGADDLGSSPAELQRRFAGFDVSLLDEVWWYTGLEPSGPVVGDWASGGEDDPAIGRQRYLDTTSERPPEHSDGPHGAGEVGFLEPDAVYEARREACQRWLAETSRGLGDEAMLVVSHYDTILSLISGKTMSRNCQLTLTSVGESGELEFRRRWTEHLDEDGLPPDAPDPLVPVLAERGAEEGSAWRAW